MHETAADLLEAVWQGISSEYKSHQRRTIWEQFENRVRSAAYTNNLGKFINSLCLRTNAQILDKHTARVNEILNSGEDKALLKLYRDETLGLVLMVHVRNQERREEWEARQGEKTQDEHASEWPAEFAKLEKEIEQ